MAFVFDWQSREMFSGSEDWVSIWYFSSKSERDVNSFKMTISNSDVSEGIIKKCLID